MVHRRTLGKGVISTKTRRPEANGWHSTNKAAERLCLYGSDFFGIGLLIGLERKAPLKALSPALEACLPKVGAGFGKKTCDPKETRRASEPRLEDS